MNILSARRSMFFALLALATASACGSAPPGALLDSLQTIEVAGSHGVDVRFRLQTENRRMQSRFTAAAVSTFKQNTAWLGPTPHSSMTIVDPPWRLTAAVPGDDAIVL